MMVSKDVQEMIPKIQRFCVDQPIKKAWLFSSARLGVAALLRGL